MDILALKKWFFSHRRDLPWRNNPTPYQVLVSEVMLQQTRVHAVIPFYHKFMEKFPSIEDLAQAPVDDVIKTWEGLGYYSRARNLHEGSKYILEHHEGKIPGTREELLKIKGIGSYTAGAILSFAFKKKASAVDANIARVMARFYAVEEKISSLQTKKRLENALMSVLPDFEPWIAVESLIELGALVCHKNPECEHCPLKNDCLAKQQNKVLSYPVKGEKKQITHIKRVVFLIEQEGSFLVKKGEKGKVMADLYEFFYLENDFSSDLEMFDFTKILPSDVNVISKTQYKRVKHSFTRYVSHLSPLHIKVNKSFSLSGYIWVAKEKLKMLPFSSGHRILVEQLHFT